MTTLTLRYQRGHFTISGPDFEMRRFMSRREAKDWCAQHPTQPSESRRDPRHPCTKNPSDCRPAIAGQRRQNLLLPPVRLGARISVGMSFGVAKRGSGSITELRE